MEFGKEGTQLRTSPMSVSYAPAQGAVYPLWHTDAATKASGGHVPDILANVRAENRRFMTVSTIIECPACSTRYKMNKAIPEGGRSVKCARCGHQWRLLPDEPEELADTLEFDDGAPESAASAGGYGAPSPEGGDAAAPENSAASWEARRGNLAAAIASMSETPGSGEGEPAEQDTDYAQARDWVSQADRYDAFAAQSPAGAESQEPSEDDAPSYAAGAKAWAGPASWTRDTATEDSDPESSVRQALKAAMDEVEAQEDDAPAFATSAVFTDARYESASSFPGMNAMGQKAGDEPSSGEDADPAGVAQIAFSTQKGHFQPAGTISLKETAEQAAEGGAGDAGAGEDTERFESDIAGIFKQQTQTKRSFGPAASSRRAQSDFTDYDMGASGAAEQADDRYMADSPLDADAAALQAAIEGSLRDKHAGEARAGAGGGGGGLALAAAWAVFLSVLSGVSLAFVNFRGEIVEALPGTAALYRGIGFSVQDRAVDFGPVTYRWTVAEGKPMIEVTGQVINLTDHEIAVPRVLVQVHDKDNTDTVKATATIRSEPLSARETADFTLEFLAPPKSISQIELAFADAD
jgi:predicted Zn finger-like uncharacterized protein